MKQLGVDAIDFYVARRQLGWAGHVRRMDFDRLPRRMLSSWVPHKRPLGAPRMTYGRSLGKALDVFDLDHSKWHELAADRCAWRAMLASGTPPPAFRALPPQPAAPPLALGRARRSSAAQTDAATRSPPPSATSRGALRCATSPTTSDRPPSRGCGPPALCRGGMALLIPKPCPENVTTARPSNTVRSV